MSNNKDKSFDKLSKTIVSKSKDIAKKKIDKAQYDKSYNAVILGINQNFVDDVPNEDKSELISKHSIPETADNGKYYTFKINGVYYVKKSDIDFKLYQKVIIRIPNGSWNNMFIEGFSSSDGIENAIIIQEKDVPVILHKYMEVDYIMGNRVVYAGEINQIIVNGYILYRNQWRGTPVPSNAQSYTTGTFNSVLLNFAENDKGETFTNTFGTNFVFSIRLKQISSFGNYEYRMYAKINEYPEELYVGFSLTSKQWESGKTYFGWDYIYAPDSMFPFGSAELSVLYVSNDNNLISAYNNLGRVGFSNEAEYNAAVGLTYEPQTLKNVIETTETVK